MAMRRVLGGFCEVSPATKTPDYTMNVCAWRSIALAFSSPFARLRRKWLWCAKGIGGGLRRRVTCG